MVTTSLTAMSINNKVMTNQKGHHQKTNRKHLDSTPRQRNISSGEKHFNASHSFPKTRKATQVSHTSTPNAKKSLNFGTPGRNCTTPIIKPCMYDKAKCFAPPTPESLPKPPTEWIPTQGSAKAVEMNPLQALVCSMQRNEQKRQDSRDTCSEHLKTLLKVNA